MDPSFVLLGEPRFLPDPAGTHTLAVHYRANRRAASALDARPGSTPRPPLQPGFLLAGNRDIVSGVLHPTPPDRLVDRRGRPYFLWDCDMTLDEFRRGLNDPDPEVRAYLVGKMMRQAKPDDVFSFVSLRTIHELWPKLESYLGQGRDFWKWLLAAWDQTRDERG